MANFRDAENRVWQVTVTVATLRRVRELASVDLAGLLDGELLDRLSSDPVLLADVLYAVCKPEADSRSVTAESFGEALAGDALDDATQALLEGLAGFFPKKRRAAAEKLIGAFRRVETKLLDAAMAKLDDPEIDARIERMISGASSTSSPDSSGSTPAP